MIYFLTVYILFYTLTLCALQYLIKTTFNTKLTFNNIPYMVYYVVNFSKLKYLFFITTLALTGIPPFLLFFVKFHYLIQLSNRVGFVTFTAAFLILFLNMLFYLQINLTKNVAFDWSKIKLKKENLNYSVIFYINMTLTFFFLSVFFMPDIFFLLNLIF